MPELGFIDGPNAESYVLAVFMACLIARILPGDKEEASALARRRGVRGT